MELSNRIDKRGYANHHLQETSELPITLPVRQFGDERRHAVRPVDGVVARTGVQSCQSAGHKSTTWLAIEVELGMN